MVTGWFRRLRWSWSSILIFLLALGFYIVGLLVGADVFLVQSGQRGAAHTFASHGMWGGKRLWVSTAPDYLRICYQHLDADQYEGVYPFISMHSGPVHSGAAFGGARPYIELDQHTLIVSVPQWLIVLITALAAMMPTLRLMQWWQQWRKEGRGFAVQPSRA